MLAPSALGVVSEWILHRTHKSRARPVCPSLTDLCLVSSSGPQGARLREGEARGSSRRHGTVRRPKEAAEGATGGKARGWSRLHSCWWQIAPPHLWCSDHTVSREDPGQADSPPIPCQPQRIAGPRAQASSCWPVIPHNWCSITIPHSACGLFPLSSLNFSIQFPPISSPGQAWLALGALSGVRATQLVVGSAG